MKYIMLFEEFNSQGDSLVGPIPVQILKAITSIHSLLSKESEKTEDLETFKKTIENAVYHICEFCISQRFNDFLDEEDYDAEKVAERFGKYLVEEFADDFVGFPVNDIYSNIMKDGQDMVELEEKYNEYFHDMGNLYLDDPRVAKLLNHFVEEQGDGSSSWTAIADEMRKMIVNSKITYDKPGTTKDLKSPTKPFGKFDMSDN